MFNFENFTMGPRLCAHCREEQKLACLHSLFLEEGWVCSKQRAQQMEITSVVNEQVSQPAQLVKFSTLVKAIEISKEFQEHNQLLIYYITN